LLKEQKLLGQVDTLKD
jgi:ribonuclease HII